MATAKLAITTTNQQRQMPSVQKPRSRENLEPDIKGLPTEQAKQGKTSRQGETVEPFVPNISSPFTDHWKNRPISQKSF
ncbi:MAG: hypothetical protein MK108_01325 [Mariniblastus sp.]|nr:hypothetical protein [Mariniblastus sp.]